MGGDEPAGGDNDHDEHEAGGGRDTDGDGGVPSAAAVGSSEGAEEARGGALDEAPRPHRAPMPDGSLHGSRSGASPFAAAAAAAAIPLPLLSRWMDSGHLISFFLFFFLQFPSGFEEGVRVTRHTSCVGLVPSKPGH